ncbi:hypothetical protein SAMN04488563_1646 [Jiangella alkaliphila]|uniref:HNH endonuclease n=1 Tax=Jiangella alkaliphila TaxID=419479 RepID=A0A1H2IE98_9ACTN|nr:hypothetical protein SAMN04488563_1646 [Jiangella alkaliphila]
MPGAWGSGGTWAWRKIRAKVLERDGWVCQLCGGLIDRTLPWDPLRPDPGYGSVHHTRGKEFGDDPAQLVAAHLGCNKDVGKPNDGGGDPDPRPWRTAPG